MTREDKLIALKNDVASKLDEIEALARSWNLPLSKLTLIARDPANDKMFIVITNEDAAGLEHAFGLSKGGTEV